MPNGILKLGIFCKLAKFWVGVVLLMHDNDGCGFLFVLREKLFSMGSFNWDHADCPLSGIKKRPVVGGLLYTSTIVISIGVIASVLCIEVVRW